MVRGGLNLLLEERTLQNHLPKPNASNNGSTNLARTFSNLMFLCAESHHCDVRSSSTETTLQIKAKRSFFLSRAASTILVRGGLKQPSARRKNLTEPSSQAKCLQEWQYKLGTHIFEPDVSGQNQCCTSITHSEWQWWCPTRRRSRSPK